MHSVSLILVNLQQILQVYLQSVMSLPIKDKNEIIVFFSTDIMRERSPVTNSGFKEGYLTKRGKNFGGWKTRYFVLKGPVLEYFENVSWVLLLCALVSDTSLSEAVPILVRFRLLGHKLGGSNGEQAISVTLTTKTSFATHS